MSPRRGAGAALTASPVLVGAVTVLVTIVAVFLSYNANSGLPFVPTYDLKANVPNAAQLVEGFEVRIGGARVGAISTIEPKRREDGSTYAVLTLNLDKEVEPIAEDTTLVSARARRWDSSTSRWCPAKARMASSRGRRSRLRRRHRPRWSSTSSSTCSTSPPGPAHGRTCRASGRASRAAART